MKTGKTWHKLIYRLNNECPEIPVTMEDTYVKGVKHTKINRLYNTGWTCEMKAGGILWSEFSVGILVLASKLKYEKDSEGRYRLWKEVRDLHLLMGI